MNNRNTDRTTAEALVQELHRRATRLEDLRRGNGVPQSTLAQVDGEVIGLRGALGIALGGAVQGGSADALGYDYYQAWLARTQGEQA